MMVVMAVVVVAVIGALASGFWHSGRGQASPTPPRSTSTPLSTFVPSPGRTWTAIENDKPGTSSWLLDVDGAHVSKNGEIEGYAGAVSAQAGEQVTLYVSTAAPKWSVSAYRVGYYGGKQGRLIWSSPDEPGLKQPAATRDFATNMVETTWSASLQVTIGADWPPGDYLLKLLSSTHAASWIPLTVRDDASHAPILINNSVTTWQAYNLWGGSDLYAGSKGRSDVVSFDRPYELGNGSGDFLGNEQRFVQLVEKAGYDVSYTTNVDIHEHPELLLRHRVLVSLGHDEYWSTAMRDGVTAARDRGVNLLFLGANAVYRHIRLEPSPLGPDRHEVNYRVAANDPLSGIDNAEVTVQWRDPPVSKPENQLLGEMYECNPVNADFVVTDPSSWVFAGTGLTQGTRLRGLVGSEYDHWNPAAGGPPAEDLARSPVVCRGRFSTSDFTYYNAPSLAGVIDTGTNLWVPKTMENTTEGAAVDQVTTNLLNAAQMGPLGKSHPAQVAPGSTLDTAAPPPTGE